MVDLISALAILLPLPASGGAPPDVAELTEDYFLGEVPVVLSASRLAQPVSESPASMTIIDREMIEASGAIDIPDVLRLVPGFQVSHIAGQNQTAQYHGLASQHPKRMQVLIDGRSVYHSAFGGVHWDTLPIVLDDIERIEVLRGSNASAFGSNAFMGVINIVTRKAVQDRGRSVSALTGYNRTREATLRFGDRLGALDYRITLDGFTTDGFPNHVHTHTWWDSVGGPADPATLITGTPLAPETTPFELARNDSQQIGRLNFRGDWLLGSGDLMLLELGYVRNDRDNVLDNGNFEFNRPDENLRAYSGLLRWSRALQENAEVSLQVSYNRFLFDDRRIEFLIDDLDTGTTLFNFGPVLGGARLRNDRFDLELEHTLNFTEGWRVAWGAGLRVDRVSSANFAVDNDAVDRWQYRLFANTERYLDDEGRWILNAGLMLEHQDDQGNFASPRLALNWHLDEFNTLRVAVSQAYRMPSFWEQKGETRLFALEPDRYLTPGLPPFDYLLYTTGDNRIEPERLDTFELGLVSAEWIPDLSLDVRYFREWLRDYIDEVRYRGACVGCDGSTVAGIASHDLLIHENAGQLDLHGLEFQGRFHISDRTWLHGAASFVWSRGRRIKERDAAGNVIQTADIGDYVPEHTFSALLAHRFDHNWNGSIAYYRISIMNWPNDGDRLNPYDRVDLRLARKLRIGGQDAQIELIGQNVWNQEYAEFRSDNRFERRLFMRMRLAFP
ncbi:MAG: hypothetical protein D6720_04380 [Gammaproteobacteria bacterium]|nr:MAG: hypothetical protein D6720_04380 [Gammaproteobacteria bacterium]